MKQVQRDLEKQGLSAESRSLPDFRGGGGKRPGSARGAAADRSMGSSRYRNMPAAVESVDRRATLSGSRPQSARARTKSGGSDRRRSSSGSGSLTGGGGGGGAGGTSGTASTPQVPTGQYRVVRSALVRQGLELKSARVSGHLLD